MGISVGVVSELDDLGEWGLLTTDAGLVVTGWNRWLERHTGIPEPAVQGKRLFDVFPDLQARKVEGYYRQALAGQTVVLSQRFHRYLLPMPPSYPGTGIDRMQQTSRIIPLVADGRVCGVVTVVEDVTERVAHELELAQRMQDLQDADQRKDEFLAMLAHELRNPLAPIGNSARVLRHTSADPAVYARCGEVIERQVAHMRRLVDDLLDVARVSRGKITLKFRSVSLEEVVNAAVEAVRPLFDDRAQPMTVTLPDRPVWLNADPSRLTQVLVNLLNNASKYSPEATPVELSAEAGSGRVMIRVKDRGAGIPRDMLTKVFDLFTQAERTMDRSQGGLGVGLTLVRRLVLLHGGMVEARSDGPGLGSEFIVQLPAGVESTPAARPEPAAAPGEPPKRRALVVDDNADAAESLAMLLRISGQEVKSVNDGLTAVRVAEEFRPDVVFCDIGLPGLDGYGVARALRATFGPKGVVLIAASGYGQEEDRQKSREAGFDHHLVKPFEFQAIAQLLASL